MNHSAIRAGAILFAIGLTAVRCLGADAGPTTPTPQRVKEIPNLEYAQANGKSLLLDLYLPPGDKPVPVILYIHGGAWRAGDRHDRQAYFLTAHGYAVASIDYRLSQEAVFPAQIEDCKAAVRWIRAHAKFYNLDSARIGAWGTSAGGHLVALLGVSGDVKALEGDEGNLDQSSRVEAVCDWFGPTDLLDFAREAAAAGIKAKIDINSAGSAIGALLGGPVQQVKENAIAANPITYVNKNAPPFLIMHGDKDQVVPLEQSRLLCQALQKAGDEAKLTVVHGAGHGFGGRAADAEVAAFFDEHLKAPAQSPATAPGASVKQ